MALEGLTSGIMRALGRIRSRRKIDEAELAAMVKDLRRALQEADFNVRQTKEITERLQSRLRDEAPRPGITMQTHALNLLYLELVRILGKTKGHPSEEQHHPHGGSLRSGKDHHDCETRRMVPQEAWCQSRRDRGRRPSPRSV